MAIVGCAIAPLFFAGGVLGTFAPSMAIAFVAASLTSLLVSITVAPVLCNLLRTDPSKLQRGSSLGRRLRTGYAAPCRACSIAVGRAILAGGAAASPSSC